jgi:hypothetical protein
MAVASSHKCLEKLPHLGCVEHRRIELLDQAGHPRRVGKQPNHAGADLIVARRGVGQHRRLHNGHSGSSLVPASGPLGLQLVVIDENRWGANAPHPRA